MTRYVDLLSDHERNYAAQTALLDATTAAVRDSDAATASYLVRTQSALEARARAKEETLVAQAAAEELRAELPRTHEGRALLERRRARAATETAELVSALNKVLTEQRVSQVAATQERETVDAEIATVEAEHGAVTTRIKGAISRTGEAVHTARTEYARILAVKVENARLKSEAAALDSRLGPLTRSAGELWRLSREAEAETEARADRIAFLRARLDAAAADARAAKAEAEEEANEAATIARALAAAVAELSETQAAVAQLRAASARGQTYFEQHKRALGFHPTASAATGADAVAAGTAPGAEERKVLAARVTLLRALQMRQAAALARDAAPGAAQTERSDASALAQRLRAAVTDDDADLLGPHGARTGCPLSLTPMSMHVPAAHWGLLTPAARRLVRIAYLQREVALRERRGRAWAQGAAPFLPPDLFRSAVSAPAVRVDAETQCEPARLDFCVQTPSWLLLGFEAEETQAALRRQDLGTRAARRVSRSVAVGAGAGARVLQARTDSAVSSVSASVNPSAAPSRPDTGVGIAVGESL